MDRSDGFLADLIPLPEAAELLGLHRATVNDMVITGRLRGYRLGARWFVKRADLDAFRHTYRRPKSSPRRRSVEARRYWTDELLRWLGHWGQATTQELHVALAIHIGNIRKYLVLAEHDGLTSRDDEGYWALTELGRSRSAALPPLDDRAIAERYLTTATSERSSAPAE